MGLLAHHLRCPRNAIRCAELAGAVALLPLPQSSLARGAHFLARRCEWEWEDEFVDTGMDTYGHFISYLPN